LNDEHVGAAHVLVDLNVHLAVGKARDVGVAQRHVELLGDLFGERAIRVAGEELQLVRHGAVAFLSRPGAAMRPRRGPHRRGWGGRDRTSVAGSKAPSPTARRRPKIVRPLSIPQIARTAGPPWVRTAQQAQPARFTRRRICRAWSSERAMPNTVGPLPDISAPTAPAAISAAFIRPTPGGT